MRLRRPENLANEKCGANHASRRWNSSVQATPMMMERCARSLSGAKGLSFVWASWVVTWAKSTRQTRLSQKLFHFFERQTHNICQRTRVTGHNEVAVLLDGVAAGLVEGVHPAEVELERGVIEGLERHLAGRP